MGFEEDEERNIMVVLFLCEAAEVDRKWRKKVEEKWFHGGRVRFTWESCEEEEEEEEERESEEEKEISLEWEREKWCMLA